MDNLSVTIIIIFFHTLTFILVPVLLITKRKSTKIFRCLLYWARVKQWPSPSGPVHLNTRGEYVFF